MSNIIHESTDKPFTIAEMYHLFSNHDTIIFRLEGMGQTVSDTMLFKQAFERIEELERIAAKYEANKHYIELGKAVEKAFEKTHQAMFVTYWQEEEGGEQYIDMNSSFNFDSVEDLLEWAEGRE